MKSKESRLIYGCMGLGGNWDHGPITPEHVLQARDVVATALEMGICTFDHADVYTFGKAEKVFGQLIKEDKGLRNKVTLQSKAGIRIPGLKEEDTVGYYDLSKEYLSAQVEQSLKNLCTDYLDVFLFHRPDPLVRVEEVAELVEKLYSSGKVKAFGVSNMSGPQIRYWQTILPQPLVVNQIQMSLGHRDFIEAGVSFNHASSPEARWFSEGTLDTCRELGLEIQAWSPLHEGVFTGRPTNNPKFQKAAALVWDLSRKYLCSPESLVLSWLLLLPQAVRPVIGTTHMGRLDACRDAEKVKLTKQDWYRLWTTVRGASLP